MNITIDIDRLRNDLINYFGTAKELYDVTTIDLINIETASDEKVVEIALENNFNLYNYEIKGRIREKNDFKRKW